MPVRETCQSARFVSAGLFSLCERCCRQASCPTAASMPLLPELTETHESKRTVVAECSDFLPTAESARFGIGKDGLRRPLKDSGIVHLCHGCPEADQAACGQFARLGLIRLSAIRTGRGIEFATTCCSTANSHVTISEPAK